MLFTETPKLRALERLMTSIPNFMPQGSGYMVLHCFEPPPEPCPEGYLTYCGKGVKCKVPHCPYLEAHIIAGRARNKVSPVRHGIQMEDREVLVESWNDQNRNPLSV